MVNGMPACVTGPCTHMIIAVFKHASYVTMGSSKSKSQLVVTYEHKTKPLSCAGAICFFTIITESVATDLAQKTECQKILLVPL